VVLLVSKYYQTLYQVLSNIISSTIKQYAVSSIQYPVSSIQYHYCDDGVGMYYYVSSWLLNFGASQP